MRLKNLVIAVVVLTALSAGVYILRRPAPPASADPRLNQPIVDAKVIDNATRLRFSDQGKSITLVRQPDGTWRVPSYHDMPADFA